MSCSNPMIAVKTGVVNPETGKDRYKFYGSLKRFIKSDPSIEEDLRSSGTVKWYSYSKDMSDQPEYLVDHDTGEVLNRAVILPCGQCLECRTAYAAHWADRIMMEAQSYDQVYFITLTYDPEHVPHSTTADGEDVLTLVPKDLQDFIKRLRRNQEYHCSTKLRFYAVGEYGNLYHRPHYHLIVFGLVLNDIEEYGRNKQGHMLHTSKTIERIWSAGRVEIEEMTWELAAYCARYTVKKLGKKETDYYSTMNIVPEFSRMSKGFGKAYFDEHARQIYEYDSIYLHTASGGRQVKPPQYFDRKYDDIYPDDMERVRIERQSAANKSLMAQLSDFSGSYVELLESKHRQFIQRTKSLRRTLE